MASYSFYQLSTTPAEKALPRLIEKIYKSGFRILIIPESQEKLEQYNNSLWTYTPLGFLPHGYNGDPTEHPIWLSLEPVNNNNASIIVFPDGNPDEIETSETLSPPNDYKKKIIVFDANSPAQMTNTIKCIKANLDESTKLWQQDSKGKWQLGEANTLVN